MKEQEYNNQVITKYLLGTLPETEAESFDELSFTDDEFAQALKSVENELIDLYVSGELTGAARESFKSHYLASATRREKVKFAQALSAFAENEAAQTNRENSEIAKSKQPSGFFSFLNIFAISNPIAQWGFAAACLVFIFLAGWLWTENTRLNQQANELQAKREAVTEREQDLQNQLAGERSANSETAKELAAAKEEQALLEEKLKTEQAHQSQRLREPSSPLFGQTPSSSSKISIASFVLLPPTRGNNSVQDIFVPAQSRLVAMQLQLESDDYVSYLVALTDQAGQKNLWRSGKIKTKTKRNNKVLNVLFPAKLLKSQIYSLAVSGINASGESEIISNYSFRAVQR